MECPCSVVRWDNCPRLHIFRRRGYSMFRIAVYFRFSHLTLLSIKNYEYFCVQNYELELRLLHNDADYGGARGVLLSVGIGKNRQITTAKNP